MVLLVILYFFGLPICVQADQDSSDSDEALFLKNQASSFMSELRSRKNLTDFVLKGGASRSLQREALVVLDDARIDLRKPFPKCTLSKTEIYEIKCPGENIRITNHGLVVDEVGIKFNPGLTFLENFTNAIRDISNVKKISTWNWLRMFIDFAQARSASPPRLNKPVSAAMIYTEAVEFDQDFFPQDGPAGVQTIEEKQVPVQ